MPPKTCPTPGNYRFKRGIELEISISVQMEAVLTISILSQAVQNCGRIDGEMPGDFGPGAAPFVAVDRLRDLFGDKPRRRTGML